MRTKEQWVEEANTTLPKCKWFIELYFGKHVYDNLLSVLNNERDLPRFYNMLNSIWFNLPDHEFNRVRKPAGWGDFIHLIEIQGENDMTAEFF